MDYEAFYQKSIQDPESFWKAQAREIAWYRNPENILSKGQDGYDRWFADGMLNLSYLCIDRHIEEGYGDQHAIIYDSPVTRTQKHITFLELQDQVARLAGGLQSLGLEKGDTAIIYMPMIPEAIYAMLACVRIGVIHSVVFGGFAPHELAIRIDDCKPKVIITACHGIEINRIIPYKPYVDQAIEEAEHQPESVLIFDRNRGVPIPKRSYDIDFEALVAGARPADPVPVNATHPSYILYTSGTTGKPKGIIRDTGGYATALKFSMRYVYGMDPGDTYWAASDVGWVVGHSYIVYGPLINRITTILFEGKPIKTPDASTFWRVISEHGVKVMFTAPTAIRAIKKEDPEAKLLEPFDLSCLKYQFLAGERCDVATLEWIREHLQVPVVDHWWQTESGWAMVSNMVGVGVKPVKPGSATLPVCGYDIQILTENGERAKPNEEGYVTVKLPLPPGTLMSLWGDPQRFREGYLDRFDGYYFSGDGGYQDEDGYIFITGRVDDIINVAGHRLSTADLEEVVAAHPAVAECAVFGVYCELRGQKPLGLVVLKSGIDIESEALEREVVQAVRDKIGAVAAFREVRIVNRLPKTRSGKILRKLLRSIANREDYNIPSTIDDPNIIDEIRKVM